MARRDKLNNYIEAFWGFDSLKNPSYSLSKEAKNTYEKIYYWQTYKNFKIS